jgi:hypothetical protein
MKSRKNHLISNLASGVYGPIYSNGAIFIYKKTLYLIPLFSRRRIIYFAQSALTNLMDTRNGLLFYVNY